MKIYDEKNLQLKIIHITSFSRLDKLLAEQLEDFSRSAIQQLFENGWVTSIEGKVLPKNAKLSVGDSIQVLVPQRENLKILPEEIPLDIVYEDDDMLVVNKPKGMVVHPAPGHSSGTLVNALLFHCGTALSTLNGTIRPGIVHRIDKDTSGLLMVAKNDFSHIQLAEQIQNHSFTRKYQAVVYGNVKKEADTISFPLGRHPVDRKKIAVLLSDPKARQAITHYQVVKRYENFTHISVSLETGRTHQIRVHMAYLGHPVAGDFVYGPKKVIRSLQGQCLHADFIGFVHPKTKQKLEFQVDLPPYFTEFLTKLKEIE